MLPEYRNHLLAAGRGIGTVNVYINRLHAFERSARTSLLDATTADLEQFLAERRSTLAAETRKSYRSAFRSYYGWAHSTGRAETNPAYPLPTIRIPITVPRIADDDAVLRSIDGAPAEEAGMILLGRLACLRLSEIATLHMRQREGDLLRIVGMGEKERLVPANDQLMEVLLRLEREQPHGYYFQGRWGPNAHQHIATVGKRITERVGSNPHSLRHAGATAAFKATHDLRAVQLMLGHASLQTTQRYLHVGMDAVRAAAAGTALVRVA